MNELVYPSKIAEVKQTMLFNRNLTFTNDEVGNFLRSIAAILNKNEKAPTTESVIKKILAKEKGGVKIDESFWDSRGMQDLAKKIALKSNPKKGLLKDINSYKINDEDKASFRRLMPKTIIIKGRENYQEGDTLNNEWLKDEENLNIIKAIDGDVTNTRDLIQKMDESAKEQPLNSKKHINIDQLITEISKDKSIMDDPYKNGIEFLTKNLKFDADKANSIIEKAVQKRDKLLSSKGLYRDDLTENELMGLQSQTQRDFDEKLRNQNLRYILPAMIERREKVIAHRLNPELLKGAFAI